MNMNSKLQVNPCKHYINSIISSRNNEKNKQNR